MDLINVYIRTSINLGLGWRPGGFRGLQLRQRGIDTVLGEFDSHTGPFFKFQSRKNQLYFQQ